MVSMFLKMNLELIFFGCFYGHVAVNQNVHMPTCLQTNRLEQKDQYSTARVKISCRFCFDGGALGSQFGEHRALPRQGQAKRCQK